MLKNFEKFINEKKVDTEFDELFATIDKHIKDHSSAKAQNLLTKDFEVIKTDKKTRYFIYDKDKDIIKLVTINDVSGNMIYYNIISDSEKGFYSTPIKAENKISNLLIYRKLGNLSKKYNLNFSDIQNKLKQKIEITTKPTPKTPLTLDDIEKNVSYKIGDEILTVSRFTDNKQVDVNKDDKNLYWIFTHPEEDPSKERKFTVETFLKNAKPVVDEEEK